MIHQCIDGGNVTIPGGSETPFMTTRVLYQDKGAVRLSGSIFYTAGVNDTVFTIQVYHGDQETALSGISPIWQSPDMKPAPVPGDTVCVPVDVHDNTSYLAGENGGQYTLTIVNDGTTRIGAASVSMFCVHAETIPLGIDGRNSGKDSTSKAEVLACETHPSESPRPDSIQVDF